MSVDEGNTHFASPSSGLPFPFSLFDLRGRTVLVAGASRGIGATLAEGLSAAGGDVIGCGRTACEQISSQVFDYRVCDLTDGGAFQALCADIASSRKNIDAFVFSAGVTYPSQSALQNMDDFSRTISTNLLAAYSCTLSALQWMSGPASIVFITSVNSALGFPGNPGYAAAKGGLRQLAKALAVDLGDMGIRVNCLAPGYVKTAMTAESYADSTRRRQRIQRTILGRWGEPVDLVGAILFLVSDASLYVTGQDIFVDGGWTAKGL
ncbi:SDR family oxidoreductase [Cyanobium sp. ATX-6F1]|uniref:SDR family oxidoreductase n=1 Tax=Cyanobium sp. ATX-6F1 TaxID=3137388 RepID=UPI0039BDB189